MTASNISKNGDVYDVAVNRSRIGSHPRDVDLEHDV